MDPQTLPQQTVSGISGSGEISLYQYFIASPLFAGFEDPEGNDRKIFLGQYISFSPALKNFLASTETAEVIHATASTYNLDDGQIYQIAVALRELITGKIFIKELPITISSRLGIDDIKAGEIVNKIISQLFGPIIEDVKRIQRGKFPDRIAQMQKESQPSNLTQPGARSDIPKSQPEPQPIRPPAPQTPPISTGPGPSAQVPFVRPLSQPQTPPRPPLTPPPPVQLPPNQPPRPDFSPRQAPLQSPPQFQSPPNPPISQPAPQPSVQKPSQPFRPSQQSPNRPQFKVPDLSGIRIPASTPSGIAEESLEKELEKVANIIDLRDKSPEE